MLNLIKKMLKCASAVILVLSFFVLVPFFLVYRKFLQYKIIEGRNERLSKGINELKSVKIGDIQQWISVRGENKKNPLLLIISGGPGFSMMPFSFIFNSLESNFTIIQWDQRGAGKTYRANEKSISQSITINQMHADTLEIVNYLRNQFKKEKIFILGHSWGSVLGLKLAQDYPELIYGYIGIGQLIHTKINEKIGYDNVLKIAYENSNKRAIKSLEKLNSFKKADLTNLTMKDFSVLRKWQFQLNNVVAIKKFDLLIIIRNAFCVPEYSLLDYFYLIRGTLNLLKSKKFFDEILNINLENKTSYCTPIYIFSGKNDFVTNPLPIYEYFKKIVAPHKEYVCFEESGHNLFFEETDKFVESLCSVKQVLIMPSKIDETC